MVIKINPTIKLAKRDVADLVKKQMLTVLKLHVAVLPMCAFDIFQVLSFAVLLLQRLQNIQFASFKSTTIYDNFCNLNQSMDQ